MSGVFIAGEIVHGPDPRLVGWRPSDVPGADMSPVTARDEACDGCLELPFGGECRWCRADRARGA